MKDVFLRRGPIVVLITVTTPNNFQFSLEPARNAPES